MASDNNSENLVRPIEVGWVQLSMILKTIPGNATVERGFTINKNQLDVNMSMESVIAQRRVKDHTIASNLDDDDTLFLQNG